MEKHIRIGTRSSLLALTQSSRVQEQIEKQHPGMTVELVRIVTKGDKILDVPLAMVGGKGLFVKEIEEALIRKEIDLAVHSMKDVPAELPDSLHLGVIPRREDPRDVFIANDFDSLDDLPAGSLVGTSSLRRRSQLANLRPDLTLDNLRGNLDTRLRKLDEGLYEAIILAAAGLNRLGMGERATRYFPVTEMLPAVGQGALGIELRRADEELLAALSFLNDDNTVLAVRAERAFLQRLEGGCQVPIGAFAEIVDRQIRLTGLVAEEDGSRIIKKTGSASCNEAESLGRSLAEEILALGGGEILARVYNQA